MAHKPEDLNCRHRIEADLETLPAQVRQVITESQETAGAGVLGVVRLGEVLLNVRQRL